MTARSTACSASKIFESYLQTLLPGTELQNDSSGTYLLGVASNSAIGKDDLYRPASSPPPLLQMHCSNPMTRRCCSPLQPQRAVSNEQMLLIGSVPVSALYAFFEAMCCGF